MASEAHVTDVYMDFEGYCDRSVVDLGAYKYAEHPSNQVLCLAYSFGLRQEPALWVPDWDAYLDTASEHVLYATPPWGLIDAIKNGARVHAHNAQFEYAIWHGVLHRVRPDLFPKIPFEQFHCTMALAANFSYPLSLDEAGKAVGADYTKDKDGKRLIRKFCMPRRPSKNNPSTRVFPWDDPEDFKNLCEYCVQDVRTETGLLRRLPKRELSSRERRIYELDFKMNRRGVFIDLETVKHIGRMAQKLDAALEKEVGRITEATGGEPLKSSQRVKIMQWARSQEYPLKDYTADTVAECADDPTCPEHVRRVLKIRKQLGKTSVKKYVKMVECTCSDGRARGMVQYHGAQRTGRFAGRLIQVHNLPRGTVKRVHEIADYIKHMDLDDLITLFGNDGDPKFHSVFDVFSSLVRSMITSGAGDVSG